jgi:hypothetical protein
MKSPLVREFIQSLNDDDLWYLHDFVFRKPVDHLVEFCDLMSRNRDMDHWLSTATSADHFFEMVDNVECVMREEIKARDEFQRQREVEREKKSKIVVKGSDLQNVRERAKIEEPSM